jgi:hypothetical protein
MKFNTNVKELKQRDPHGETCETSEASENLSLVKKAAITAVITTLTVRGVDLLAGLGKRKSVTPNMTLTIQHKDPVSGEVRKSEAFNLGPGGVVTPKGEVTHPKTEKHKAKDLTKVRKKLDEAKIEEQLAIDLLHAMQHTLPNPSSKEEQDRQAQIIVAWSATIADLEAQWESLTK